MKFFAYILFLFTGLASAQNATDAEADKKQLQAVVKTWSAALNDWNLQKLKKLYGPAVLFYGAELSKEKCINKKASQLNPSDIFSHSIVTPIRLRALENGIIKAEFTKRVILNGKVNDYPSYLLLKHNGYDYKIIGESDLITDRKLGFELDLKYPASRKPGAPKENNEWLIISCLALIALGLIFYFLIRKTKKATQGRVEAPEENTLTTASGTAPVESHITEELPRDNVSNLQVGYEFEKFVVNMFDKNYFKCLVWQGDKSANGIIPEGNSNPDLVYHFELREFKRKFAVECKFRSQLTNANSVEICTKEKLQKYIRYGIDNKLSVYLIIGFGGEPFNPRELFIVPVKRVNPVMKYTELKRYGRSTLNRLFYDVNKDELT